MRPDGLRGGGLRRRLTAVDPVAVVDVVGERRRAAAVVEMGYRGRPPGRGQPPGHAEQVRRDAECLLENDDAAPRRGGWHDRNVLDGHRGLLRLLG